MRESSLVVETLERVRVALPFALRALDVDYGSEYLNRHGAELLNKLLIEKHTKSRSRNSSDNAQAESKNASIVRKHFGASPAW